MGYFQISMQIKKCPWIFFPPSPLIPPEFIECIFQIEEFHPPLANKQDSWAEHLSLKKKILSSSELLVPKGKLQEDLWLLTTQGRSAEYRST